MLVYLKLSLIVNLLCCIDITRPTPVPVQHPKIDLIYGREGTDIVIDCADVPLAFTDLESVEFEWELLKTIDRTTVEESDSGQLELDNLRIDNTGLYKCTITTADNDGGTVQRSFIRQLVVYELPSHYFHTVFHAQSKSARCNRRLIRKIEKQAYLAFCPPGNFFVCPFRFETTCHNTPDPELKLTETKIIQKLDLEFKIPNCDPSCIFEEIDKRMEAVFQLGKERMERDFVKGPIVPPPKLDKLSKFMYVHGVNELPLIMWESDSNSRMVIRCHSGFEYILDALICIPCAPGAFSLQGITCELCPEDTYQDRYAQEICTPCTNRRSTLGVIGAVNEDYCRETGRHRYRRDRLEDDPAIDNSTYDPGLAEFSDEVPTQNPNMPFKELTRLIMIIFVAGCVFCILAAIFVTMFQREDPGTLHVQVQEEDVPEARIEQIRTTTFTNRREYTPSVTPLAYRVRMFGMLRSDSDSSLSSTVSALTVAHDDGHHVNNNANGQGDTSQPDDNRPPMSPVFRVVRQSRMNNIAGHNNISGGDMMEVDTSDGAFFPPVPARLCPSSMNLVADNELELPEDPYAEPIMEAESMEDPIDIADIVIPLIHASNDDDENAEPNAKPEDDNNENDG